MRGFRFGRRSVVAESTPMVPNFLEIAGPIAQAKREAAEHAEEMALLNRVSEAATEPVQTGVKDSVSETLSGRRITQETYVELPKSLEGDILHTLHKSNCEGLITLIDGKMHLKLWDFKDFVNWGKYGAFLKGNTEGGRGMNYIFMGNGLSHNSLGGINMHMPCSNYEIGDLRNSDMETIFLDNLHREKL